MYTKNIMKSLVADFAKCLLVAVLGISFSFTPLVPIPKVYASESRKEFKDPNAPIPDQILAKSISAPEKLTSQEAQFIQQHFHQPLKISIEIIHAFKLLKEKVDRLDREIGLEEIERRIKSGVKKENIEAEIKKIAKAEYLYLPKSDVFIPRATHYGTNLSYLYLDGTGIKPNNPELQHFLNKQLFVGSQTEWEVYRGEAKSEIRKQNPKTNFRKKNYGREHIIISTGRDGELKSEHIKKARLGSLRRLQQWVDAVYEKPKDRAAVELGVGSGTVQFIMALSIEGIKVTINEEKQFSYVGAVLSILYGSVIGVYNSTYRNIIYTDSPFMQTVKHWGISLSFSYLLFSFSTDYFWALQEIDIRFLNELMSMEFMRAKDTFIEIWKANPGSESTATRSALFLHFWAWMNNIANNWARVHWNQIPRMRQLMGESARNFSMKIPASFSIPIAKIKKGEPAEAPVFKVGGKEVVIPWLNLRLERGSVDFKTPKFLKPGAELVTPYDQRTVEAQAVYSVQYFIKIFDLLMGVPLLLISIPFVATFNVLYAEKVGNKDAKHLRKAYEKTRFAKNKYLDAIPLVNPLYRTPFLKQGIYQVASIVALPYTLPKKLIRNAKAYRIKKNRACKDSF